ncbi:MAG: hypothetical protein KC443_17740, partial [Anaerolineales bacterium]|nr:hypothetical protein [Anaerolineales bacterium]
MKREACEKKVVNGRFRVMETAVLHFCQCHFTKEVFMFRQYLFNWISRLIFRRGYEEHHGQCEDAYAARLGPLHLEINRCFVLNHEDAFVSLCLPLPMQRANSSSWGWGKLFVGYVVCLGEDEIRCFGSVSNG